MQRSKRSKEVWCGNVIGRGQGPMRARYDDRPVSAKTGSVILRSRGRLAASVATGVRRRHDVGGTAAIRLEYIRDAALN